MKKTVLYFLAALLLIPTSAIAQDRPVERRDLQRQQQQGQRQQQRQQQRQRQQQTIYYEYDTSNKTAWVSKIDEKYKGSITIPESVTHNGTKYTVTLVGSYSFRDCTGVTSVTIPKSVTGIGHYAFYNCTGLTSVTIPSSVINIFDFAFAKCTGLKSITVNAITPPNLLNCNSENHFWYTNNCPIYVPAQSVSAYKAAKGWSKYYADRIRAK